MKAQPKDVAAAYVVDRAGQYSESSGIYHAMIEVAHAIRRNEADESFRHGELDDILERWGIDVDFIDQSPPMVAARAFVNQFFGMGGEGPRRARRASCVRDRRAARILGVRPPRRA